MTKKLLVPMLAVGLGIGFSLQGCGSDDNKGTGGSGGAAAGAGGSTGGSGGSTGGSGGSTGGSGGSTGGSGGASGGSGGASGGSGGASGGSGGASGGSGGAAGGSGGAAGGSGGAAGGAGGAGGAAAVDWTMCPASGSLDGVSAQDFCAQYDKACMFDTTGGAAMMERFKNTGDCTSGYMGASAAKKGCMAYHLCVASKGGDMKTTHCPHPPEAVLATPAGPCAAK